MPGIRSRSTLAVWALVVATLVVTNLNTSDSRNFEHVVHNQVQDQINGIRDLIDGATR